MKFKVTVTRQDIDDAERFRDARTALLSERGEVENPRGILWNSASCSCPIAVAIHRKLSKADRQNEFVPEVGTRSCSFTYRGKQRLALKLPPRALAIIQAFDACNDPKPTRFTLNLEPV